MGFVLGGLLFYLFPIHPLSFDVSVFVVSSNWGILAIIGSIFTNFKGSDIMELISDIIEDYVVARGGIEPPTHGFSVRFNLLLLNLIV